MVDSNEPIRPRLSIAIGALEWAAEQVAEYPQASTKLRGIIAGIRLSRQRAHSKNRRSSMTDERLELMKVLWGDWELSTREILVKLNELPGPILQISSIYVYAHKLGLPKRKRVTAPPALKAIKRLVDAVVDSRGHAA